MKADQIVERCVQTERKVSFSSAAHRRDAMNANSVSRGKCSIKAELFMNVETKGKKREVWRKRTKFLVSFDLSDQSVHLAS